jgi:hypothetical protein
MKKSERINLIKNISGKLQDEDFPTIDLILRQFGLPQQDIWSGDKKDYIAAMIATASDDALLELAEYAQVNVSIINLPTDHDCWKEGYFRLFLSHESPRKVDASALQEALEKFAISAFVAHLDIKPMREWQIEIEKALWTSDALAALLTPRFHAGDWGDQEIGVAIGRRILIIPVKLGLDPYGFIAKYQAILGERKTHEQLATEIKDILKTNEITQKRLAQAVVYKFCKSDSFQQSKDNFRLLREFEQLIDANMATELENALQNNGQINGAFGIPQGLKYMVERIKGR